jgi:HTH-type transcriptional regulator / antitoxin HigA
MLIPMAQWHHFISQTGYQTQAWIETFAQEMGIAPGMVVGRLQREERIPKDALNELKRRLVWDEQNIAADEHAES